MSGLCSWSERVTAGQYDFKVHRLHVHQLGNLHPRKLTPARKPKGRRRKSLGVPAGKAGWRWGREVGRECGSRTALPSPRTLHHPTQGPGPRVLSPHGSGGGPAVGMSWCLPDNARGWQGGMHSGRESCAVRKVTVATRSTLVSWDSYFSLQIRSLAFWFLKPYTFHLHSLYIRCFFPQALGVGILGGRGVILEVGWSGSPHPICGNDNPHPGKHSSPDGP